MEDNGKVQKWYEQTWVIVLFLIFIWPIGLFLMWRFADWSKAAKVIVTIIVATLWTLWIVLIMIAINWFSLALFDTVVGDEEFQEWMDELEREDLDLTLEEFEESDSLDRFARMDSLELYFDDRDWQLGFQDEQSGNIIMEYVLEGETVEAWSELVTAQFLGGMAGASPRDLADSMEESLYLSSDGELDWKVFDEEDDELMYEFILTDDSVHEDQHEIARVIAVDDGLFVIHYVTEGAPMSAETYEMWLDLLKKARVK